MKTDLSNRDLATVIVTRLNALLSDPDVRQDIQKLIETRVSCSKATKDHETIQIGDGEELGFLGLLNGIVGRRDTKPYEGWGHISAVFGDDGRLETFALLG